MTGIARLWKAGRHVVRVRRGLIVLQMASHARRAVQRVVVVDVAIAALARRYRVHAGQREPCRRVVEFAIAPLHRVVALLAGGGESCVSYGRGCVVVIVLVAADASRAADAVVVIHVTIAALARRHTMRPGQRESRLGVIEGRRLPRRSVVAGIAGLGESSCHMVWVSGVLKILEVAGDASRTRQVVVVIDVAIATLARRNGVGTSECEVHHGVIELRGRPCDRAVALHTVGGKVSRNVIGVCRALEIWHVTAGASRR